MKNQFTEDREQARDEYEEELKRLQEQYHNISEELKAEFKEKILLSFNNFQSSFDALANSYDTQMFLVILSIHQKIYGLKEHSMTQRIMIMSLYTDFCDADYYNSFRSCQEQNMPYMSDDFDTLISKLIDIQWESVISNSEIPGKPIKFSSPKTIDSETFYRGKTNFIVSNLRKTGQVEINLKDLDENHYFDSFWRIRIETVKMKLLDNNSYPIQSAGTDFDEGIQIRIHYPTFFNDTDNYKNSVGFLAQNFVCNADYATHGEDIDWFSECEIDEPFSQDNYKPGLDGVFTFKIVKPETIDLESLSKVWIRWSGTSIPFNLGEYEDEESIVIQL